jgi:hypothetical protein
LYDFGTDDIRDVLWQSQHVGAGVQADCVQMQTESVWRVRHHLLLAANHRHHRMMRVQRVNHLNRVHGVLKLQPCSQQAAW